METPLGRHTDTTEARYTAGLALAPHKWNWPLLTPFNTQNRRVAAEIAETQAGIQALDALHEILHLAGRNTFDDFVYADTVARMRGVAAPDFRSMPYKEGVRRASEYWNGALQTACKPR
jgi:hypothetical protein